MWKIIERDELRDLVPHKGRMFLLDRVVACDLENNTLCTETKILPSCLFFDAALGGIPAWVSFELMAQSISALSGIRGRESGKRVMPGFILSVSGLAIETPVMRNGETARVTVCQDCVIDAASNKQLGSAFTFECEASIGGKIAARALITAVETGLNGGTWNE